MPNLAIEKEEWERAHTTGTSPGRPTITI